MKYLIAILALAGSPVLAQANCKSHSEVVDHLANNFAESRQAIGLGADGSVVEVFAAENGSWTITVTKPGGPTCLVAAGQAFQYLNEPLPALGDEG